MDQPPIERPRLDYVRKVPKHEQLIDIASAFNFERKGLKTILEYTMSGTPVEVVVSSQDRLARSGFQLIRWIIELSRNRTYQFYYSPFCKSYYGKRSAERKKKKGVTLIPLA